MAGRVYELRLSETAWRLLEDLRDIEVVCPSAARVLEGEVANAGHVFVTNDEDVAAGATDDVIRLKESPFLEDLAAAARAIKQLVSHRDSSRSVH